MASDVLSELKWEKVPFSILVDIFSYLPLSDRRNASLTCKSWNSVFYCSLLWQSFDCLFAAAEFDEGNSLVNKKASLAASHFGRWFVRLAVVVRECSYHIKEIHQNLQEFFKVLSTNDNKPKLKELRFLFLWDTDLTRQDSDETFQETILKMNGFLLTQNKLKLFTSNLYTSLLHGCLVLDAISESSLSITELNLVSHFDFEVKRDPKVIYMYLKKFSNLSTLHIDYEDLGEELLLSLAKNCQKTLNSISIRIWIIDRNFEFGDVSAISSDVWLHVKNLVPELKVKIRLDVASINGDLVKQVLPSTVPVSELDVWDNCPSAASITYYWQSFWETLEKVNLFCGRAKYEERPQFGTSLVSLVQNCVRLQSFDFTGKISLDKLQDLYDFLRNGTSGLKRICIHMICLTPEERTEFVRLRKQYNQLIENEKIPIDFFLLCNVHNVEEDDDDDDNDDEDNDDDDEELPVAAAEDDS